MNDPLDYKHLPKDKDGDRFPDFHHDNLKELTDRIAAVQHQIYELDHELKRSIESSMRRIDALGNNVSVLLQIAQQDEKRIVLLGG
jgi:hypothetical protein